MTERKADIPNSGQPTGERGVALIIALLALTVLTGIGFAIMVSSSTESLINAGFRRAGLAHFAAMGGVEEMRGRMGPDAAPLTNNLSSVKIPCSDGTTCPLLYNTVTRVANLGKAYYIRLSNLIDPSDPNCLYLGMDCTDPDAPAASADRIIFTTTQPGTATTMPYVWVKATLATQMKLKRRMGTGGGPCNPSDPLDPSYCDPATLDDANMICRKGLKLIVGNPAAAPAYSNCGDPVVPVFVYTALSIQPGRATRVVRELAAVGSIPNLPGGLTLDGCPSVFPPPTSHPFELSGIDGGSCGAACNVHSVVTRCQADMETIQNLITDGNKCAPAGAYTVATPNFCQAGPNRNGDYPGLGNQNCNNPNCNNTSNSADIFYDASMSDPDAQPFFANCSGLQEFVSLVEDWADYTYPANTNSLSTHGDGSNANPDLWDRVVNVIEGDASLSQADFGDPGAGIILVKGTLTVNGYPSYNGAILVIGTGNMVVSGAGNGTINGGIFVANTSTCAGTGLLGPVSYDNPGGGTFNLNYNSDAIKPKDGLLPMLRLSLNY